MKSPILSLTLLLLLPLSAGAALSVELRASEVRTGTEGLQRLPLTIANRSDRQVVCVGELAHWFSAELARLGAGETVEIELWFDPVTGTTSALNDSRENMPVEALWCGIAGRAYETRSLVALPRIAGANAADMTLTCVMGEERLSCA